MKQAVILAGGKGVRLAPRLQGRPKPLVDVNGAPLLERQITTLARYGIEHAVVLVNHAANQVADFFAEREFGVEITLLDDGEPLGTAGATMACLEALADSFLIVYGDTLFNIDITRFVASHRRTEADVTLFLHPNDHPQDSDLVEVDDDDSILTFHSYPHPQDAWLPNLVNAAFYAVEKRALWRWRDFPRPSDFAKDLFPAMLKAGARLKGYRSFEYIKDLGTPQRLDKVTRDLRSGVVERTSLGTRQACAFLDRDGTLNQQLDYVRSPEQLELLPGAAEAVKRLNEAEFRIAIITNQPVIARGEVSSNELRRIHAKMETLLGNSGALLDLILYCPHHPDSGFPGEVAALKTGCGCRKPATGLLQEAAARLNADLERSWLVGDGTADIAAAAAFGVRAVLVRTGSGGRDAKYSCRPDFVVDDVLEAARLITELHPRILAGVNRLLPQVGPGQLILIGGLARSGKSTVAATLADALRRHGVSASVLALDSWIRPLAERGGDVLGRFDLDDAQAKLGPWFSGEALRAQIPSYDRLTRASGQLQLLQLAAEDVLILEGVPALLRDWAGVNRKTHCLYVTAEERARADRVVSDLIARGADLQQAQQIYQARVRDESALVAASQSRAHYTISLDEAGRDY